MLEPNYKTLHENNHKIADTIPRLVHICSRTEEGFDHICKWIEDNPSKVTRDFLNLLIEPMNARPTLNSPGFPHRGNDNSYKLYITRNQSIVLYLRLDCYQRDGKQKRRTSARIQKALISIHG